jgi:4-diphosphocytidyl-2-C-methyl-D-erythritol kinase
MGKLAELAPAKVNLTLQVRGKRPDGYHEIESLVMFADYGDTLSFEPADKLSLAIDGPFAGALDGSGNLVEKAAVAYAEVTGIPAVGAFHLTKRLPVAAGIGGGSADAAAAFRLLQRHYGVPVSLSSLISAARNIGADVPACLKSSASIMTGIGEKLHVLPRLEPVPAILVNPMQPLPTAPVFRALASGPLPGDFAETELPYFVSLEEIIAYASAGSNDLEAPAWNLLPVVGEVLAMLEDLPGVLLRRVSGSGPTCFAIFRDMNEAESAALMVARGRPDWWVHATRLT